MALDYPVGRLMSIFLKPTLEKKYAEGLENLKRVTELEAPRN
jgi:hypothetical protein